MSNICTKCGQMTILLSQSPSGSSGTTSQLRVLGGAGTSGAQDVGKWPEAQKLKTRWSDIGLNNHEEASLNLGYAAIISNYLKLKLKVLELRDNPPAGFSSVFFEALRIYVYTIYENLFYGYVISNSSDHTSAFIFDKFNLEYVLPLQYYNHLPSFSLALLHFGNCRDLLFILMAIFIQKQNAVVDSNAFNALTEKRYTCKDFLNDLKILSKGDMSYLKQGEDIFNTHMFRNIYEHRFRLLWWRNRKSKQDIYYIKRELFDAIMKRDTKVYKKLLYDMLKSPQVYENDILNSDPSKLISSQEILIYLHDKIAPFFNLTLDYIPDFSIKNVHYRINA